LTVSKTGTYTAVMGRQRLFGAVLVLVTLWLASPMRPTAQSRERSLYVSVVDQTGGPVSDLGASDFVVKEDNVTREVLRVVPAIDPMQIAVLVDTSQAARGDIAHLRSALPPFVAALTAPSDSGRRNEISIVGIGERPTILAGYSIDARVVQKGIDRIWPLTSSGMYLLDGIMEVCQGLKKRQAGRPVIVSIATEGPDFSNRMHDQALDPMREGGVAFYAFSIGQPSTSLRSPERERAILLDEGPKTTGGYHEQLLTSMSLEPKLKLLAQQLTHEYRVTYARPESLIPPEHTTVGAVKPGLTARGTPVIERAPK
jgi:hypothetical protein